MTAASGFQVEKRGDATLAVSGELTFDTAHAALLALRGSFRDSGIGTLDLAGVDRSDSAGLACVLAVLAGCRNDGRSLVVQNVPDGMRMLARVCEAEPLLASS